MKLRTLFYNIGQGMKNIRTNKMFSIASIATMTACIFLFGLFFSLGVNFSSMVKNAEEGVAVTVFFDEGLPQEQIDKIGEAIRGRQEVDNVKYVSPEEAWATFRQEYFPNNPELAEGFADDNPLANSANFEVYLKDVSRQQILVDFIKQQQGVREVRQSELTAKTLTDFNSLIAFISIVVVLILVLVSIFLISNTITVGISVRKEEIAIMKLIGARDNFVRSPFIVEGILIGLIGSVIPLILLFILYRQIIEYVSNRFLALSSMMTFVPARQVFVLLIPVALVLGIGIGYLGSRLTLKRHQNV